jgi:beta-galactosidase GanA
MAINMKLKNRMKGALPLIALLSPVISGCGGEPVPDKEIPHLEKRGDVTQLIVDGKPWLALAGELHNSSSSTEKYMTDIWPKLKATNLNTVLAVVSWEQIEPEEGKFEFRVVDDLLEGARQHGMKLMILWFGAWKNGITSYVPHWVQRDQERFPLVRTKEGNTLNILTTMGEQTLEADARAYAEMMKHLAQTDKERTVVMIQVQNEVGLHGDTRDYHPKAVEAFNSPVPQPLMDYLVKFDGQRLLPELQAAWDSAGHRTAGTWEEVFGKSDYTDELFMAWNYARYLDVVAEAGKEAYPLPTFVNAWIVQPQDRHPGDYPSGGPQAQNHDVWRAGAPNIDMLCPDIYLPDFPGILGAYSRLDNPVFIPESSAGVAGSANAFYAVGQMGAIGYSPFGIDGRVSDPAVEPLTRAYATLASLSDMILEHQAAGTIRAAWLKQRNPAIPEMTCSLGNYDVKFALRTTRNSSELPQMGYGLVMLVGPDEYLVAGYDAEVTFQPRSGEGIAGLAKVQAGDMTGGEWVPSRWLNGDEIQLRYDLKQAQQENLSGQGLRFRTDNTLQRVWLYTY